MNRGLLGFPSRVGVRLPALADDLRYAYTQFELDSQQNPITSGIVRWYKADAGVTKDGSDRVSQWDDQSGSAQHATQATAGNQPLWVTGILDGIPAIRFVSSRPDHMGVDLSAMTNTDYTVYVVTQRSATGNKYLMGAITSGTSNTSLHIGWQAATNWRCGHWGADVDSSVPDYVASRPVIMGMIRKSGTGRKNFSLGQDLTLSTNTSALTGINGGGTIGRAVGVNYDGDIFEILVYNRALTREEQLRMDLYFAYRYPSLGAFRDF